jgi:hypothetical protein
MTIVKISRQILPLIITLGLSSATFAFVPHNFYLGAQAGTATHGVHAKEHDEDYVLSVNKNNLAGRVYGGYQFGTNFGTELGYAKYKNVPLKHLNGGSAKQQSLDLVAKGSLPIANNFGIFGEAGVAYVDNKISPTLVREGFEDKNIRNHKFKPLYGAGASFDVQNVRLNAGWRRIQHSKNFHDIDLGYVGATFYLA